MSDLIFDPAPDKAIFVRLEKLLALKPVSFSENSFLKLF